MVLLLGGSSLVQTYGRQTGRLTSNTLGQLPVDMLRAAAGNGTAGQEERRKYRGLHRCVEKPCRKCCPGSEAEDLALYLRTAPMDTSLLRRIAWDRQLHANNCSIKCDDRIVQASEQITLRSLHDRRTHICLLQRA